MNHFKLPDLPVLKARSIPLLSYLIVAWFGGAILTGTIPFSYSRAVGTGVLSVGLTGVLYSVIEIGRFFKQSSWHLYFYSAKKIPNAWKRSIVHSIRFFIPISIVSVLFAESLEAGLGLFMLFCWTVALILLFNVPEYKYGTRSPYLVSEAAGFSPGDRATLFMENFEFNRFSNQFYLREIKQTSKFSHGGRGPLWRYTTELINETKLNVTCKKVGTLAELTFEVPAHCRITKLPYKIIFIDECESIFGELLVGKSTEHSGSDFESFILPII